MLNQIFMIFISHSKKDFSRIEKYIASLEAIGLECWVAPRDIPKGVPFAKAIAEAINKCNIFIVFISNNAFLSDHVLNEIDLASSWKKKIIPVFLENVILRGEFAYYLKRRQWIEGSDNEIMVQLECLVNGEEFEEPGLKDDKAISDISEDESLGAFEKYSSEEKETAVEDYCESESILIGTDNINPDNVIDKHNEYLNFKYYKLLLICVLTSLVLLILLCVSLISRNNTGVESLGDDMPQSNICETDSVKEKSLPSQKEFMLCDTEYLNSQGKDYYNRGLIREANTCFEITAERQDVYGQYMAGICNKKLGFREDNKGEKEKANTFYKKAFEYFILASSQGDERAAYQLAMCYIYGSGTARNHIEGIRILKKLAEESSHTEALFKIGRFYKEGKAGLEHNDKKAFEYYLKAAKLGHAEAQNSVAVFYERGFDVCDINMSEAAIWYKKSAEQNFVYAQYNLGRLYRDGNGVPKDTAEAIKWFKLAKENGSTDAIKALKKLGID